MLSRKKNQQNEAKKAKIQFCLPSKLEFSSFGCSSTDFGETYSKLPQVGGRGLRHWIDDDDVVVSPTRINPNQNENDHELM